MAAAPHPVAGNILSLSSLLLADYFRRQASPPERRAGCPAASPSRPPCVPEPAACWGRAPPGPGLGSGPTAPRELGGGAQPPQGSRGCHPHLPARCRHRPSPRRDALGRRAPHGGPQPEPPAPARPSPRPLPTHRPRRPPRSGASRAPGPGRGRRSARRQP
uniref:atherin-like n=1 Tax=Lonchura striata TaxID=40157 RepID=UPI000B4CEF3A|nr:atherin-like [Lonchura striata domestica]